MDVARIEDIETRVFEPARRTGRDHRAWILALVVSISAHVLMVWLWSFSKPEPHPETISLQLQLQAALMKPSTQASKTENIAASSKQSLRKESQLGITRSSNTESLNIDAVRPAEPKHPRPETESSAILTPPTTPSATSRNVFDPRLQAKLNSPPQERAELTPSTYTDISGSTQVDFGRGSCFRSAIENSRGISQNWYLTQCNNRKSEGDTILQGLNDQLKHRARQRVE